MQTHILNGNAKLKAFKTYKNKNTAIPLHINPNMLIKCLNATFLPRVFTWNNLCFMLHPATLVWLAILDGIVCLKVNPCTRSFQDPDLRRQIILVGFKCLLQGYLPISLSVGISPFPLFHHVTSLHSPALQISHLLCIHVFTVMHAIWIILPFNLHFRKPGSERLCCF